MSEDANIHRQLGEVKGQLASLMTLLASQHTATQTSLDNHHKATNQRIDDLRTAMATQATATEKRIDGLSGRVGTLEANERATALKAAGISAVSGGVIAAFIAVLKMKAGG